MYFARACIDQPNIFGVGWRGTTFSNIVFLKFTSHNFQLEPSLLMNNWDIIIVPSPNFKKYNTIVMGDENVSYSFENINMFAT